jgi:hypothetical protein
MTYYREVPLTQDSKPVMKPSLEGVVRTTTASNNMGF